MQMRPVRVYTWPSSNRRRRLSSTAGSCRCDSCVMSSAVAAFASSTSAAATVAVVPSSARSVTVPSSGERVTVASAYVSDEVASQARSESASMICAGGWVVARKPGLSAP